MFFEDPEKSALDDDNYNSIQLEEIKVLRQSLNAKNNDTRLIESNMNQHIKTIKDQMLALVEENQQLKNHLCKVKTSVI